MLLGGGRARDSEWNENSFIMVVYKKILKFTQNFLSKVGLKKFVIDNHYKTIFISVRMACYSPPSVGELHQIPNDLLISFTLAEAC